MDIFSFREEEEFVLQDYLPQGMTRPVFYKPGTNGYERSISERMERWEEERKNKGDRDD
ncbi:MAG: hypothetical protein KGZ63_07885 [Clostridiales bacterium]|jgi:replication-associated recombination protein RarA|nr:hypothetical protein [Clostridiales bacterium]